MQPTYLPWAGYFGLISSVDIFVILDSVQFSKRSWQQRNKIKTQEGPIWLTVPVITKGKRDQKIYETKINKENCFQEKHIKSLEFNYKKSDFYMDESDQLFSYIRRDTENLADLNIEIIKYLCERFYLKTEILRSSDLRINGKKSDLLCSICKEVNAKKYISPPGSKIYLEQSIEFKEANIPIIYFEYDHPTYNQLWGDFIPYMSVVDMLFNCGQETINIITKNIKAGF